MPPYPLENFSESQQLMAIEIIIEKAPDLERFCALSEIFILAEEQLSPILNTIYEMRLSISQEDSKGSKEIQSSLHSRLEDLRKKVLPEKIPEITEESLVSFLSCTSDFLFQKAGDALAALPAIIYQEVSGAIKARSNPNISQSMCEQAINSTIDSTFKAIVSGVMTEGVKEGVQTLASGVMAEGVKGANQTFLSEFLTRNVLGIGGVAVSNALTPLVNSKTTKPLVKSGAKTIAKSGGKVDLSGVSAGSRGLLGASVAASAAALGGLAVSTFLPKYSADVAMHGVISGVAGYLKTGTIAGAMSSAAHGAVSRGIYSYGWEVLDGKTYLNNANFVEAGRARIAAKMAADQITTAYPVVGAAAVAGMAIVENVRAYIKDNKNPVVQSAVKTIENNVSDLQTVVKNTWNKLYEIGADLNRVSMQMHGYDVDDLKPTISQTPKVSSKSNTKEHAIKS
ncbi:MAG: hypothetical protein WBJ81_06490 [Rickettsiales bacterium]